MVRFVASTRGVAPHNSRAALSSGLWGCPLCPCSLSTRPFQLSFTNPTADTRLSDVITVPGPGNCPGRIEDHYGWTEDHHISWLAAPTDHSLSYLIIRLSLQALGQFFMGRE